MLLQLVSCVQEEENSGAFRYSINRPDYFPPIEYPIEANPTTKEGFDLGKKLFNDPRLSIDNSISCSSCHVKGKAFTDPQHNPSLGIFERVGLRNAPMIANIAFQSEFLWDGGITHLDFVPIFAIENEREMGETMAGVVSKLKGDPVYRTAFQKAFPQSDSITAPFLLKAMSQYMLLLVSDQSRFDEVMRGEAVFTAQEQRGKALFDKNCATCHSGALFTNNKFINNGLDSVFADIGRSLISETSEDLGKFKVPSLRNIMLTGPYMHDGRFKTIDEVIDHYRFGIRPSPSLDTRLMVNGSMKIQLENADVDDLKDFLHTLTDRKFISNPIF